MKGHSASKQPDYECYLGFFWFCSPEFLQSLVFSLVRFQFLQPWILHQRILVLFVTLQPRLLRCTQKNEKWQNSNWNVVNWKKNMQKKKNVWCKNATGCDVELLFSTIAQRDLVDTSPAVLLDQHDTVQLDKISISFCWPPGVISGDVQKYDPTTLIYLNWVPLEIWPYGLVPYSSPLSYWGNTSIIKTAVFKP